jgi:hypothetical protein
MFHQNFVRSTLRAFGGSPDHTRNLRCSRPSALDCISQRGKPDVGAGLANAFGNRRKSRPERQAFANLPAGTQRERLAVIATLLAAVGLYGVLSFVVGSRTREIGIRIACGVRTVQIFRLLFGQGLKLALTVAALVSSVTILATSIPATRAAKVDPVISLKTE